MTAGPNRDAVGAVAARQLGPILYALEVCAVSMDQAGRPEDARYYRGIASELADAGGSESAGAPSG
ncbi:MAG TPA: hypothetical protein VGA37_07550 [Gemmatimonadales bacterium]